MKHQIYTVYDKATEAFLPPFYAPTEADAKRSFVYHVNEPTHNFHVHAHDFTLHYLGEYDDNSGLIESVEPMRVCSAVEVKKKST